MEDYKALYLKLLKSVASLNIELKSLLAQMESTQNQCQKIVLETIDELPVEILEEAKEETAAPC